MPKKSIWMVILLAVAVSSSGAQDAPSAPVSEIEVTTQGAEATFAPTQCGMVASTLSGRVVRRAHTGELVPVGNAVFSYIAHDGSATKLAIPVSLDGRFEQQVFVNGSTYTFLSSGPTVRANASRSRLRLSVNAPGCDAEQVILRANREARDVVLQCPSNE